MGKPMRKRIYHILEALCLLVSIAGSILAWTDSNCYVMALLGLALFAVLKAMENRFGP